MESVKRGGGYELAAHGALGTAMQSAPNLRVAPSTLADLNGAHARFFP